MDVLMVGDVLLYSYVSSIKIIEKGTQVQLETSQIIGNKVRRFPLTKAKTFERAYTGLGETGTDKAGVPSEKLNKNSARSSTNVAGMKSNSTATTAQEESSGQGSVMDFVRSMFNLRGNYIPLYVEGTRWPFKIDRNGTFVSPKFLDQVFYRKEVTALK
ncbi:hypothetical protein HK102_013298 [Quaeritorhiza haematococci]|nr:hypothetical protein HK102_013298 [Quaeritorhiza haematococci]